MKKYHSREERDRKLTVRSYVIAATIGIGLVIITALGIRYYISQTQPPAQETVFDKEKLIGAYERRDKYITNRLQAIADKNNARFRQEMEAEIEEAIVRDGTEDFKNRISQLRDYLNESYDKQEISFFKENEAAVPVGMGMCMPIVGLNIFMNNPGTISEPEVASDDTVTFCISRGRTGTDEYTRVRDIIMYNNAMRYVYEFFDGMITKQQLDSAIEEIMRSTDPEYTITKEFKGRQYTFSYDAEWTGTITIKFKID